AGSLYLTRTLPVAPLFPYTTLFRSMTRKDFLPHNLEGVETNRFIYYVWQAQQIRFLPSNQDNDIKIDYIRQLFPDNPASIDQDRSEEHTSELQSRENLVCRLLLEKK